MYFVTEIGFLFRRAFSIISTMIAKYFAVPCTAEFTDRKRKIVNDAIRTDGQWESRKHFLP